MLKRSLVLILILSILITIIGGCVFKKSEQIYVESVIDGDTVKTAAGNSIRLLGVDTPEINWGEGESDFYAQAARKFTVKNLKGKNVDVEYDIEKEDKYGRKLAYIFQNGENFNQKLLENGYATLMIIAPNKKYEKEFKQAVRNARQKQVGIWSRIQKSETYFPVISYKDAKLYLGQKVILQGEIIDSAVFDSVNYLNFSKNYQETLSLVIFSQNLNKFDYQPTEYLLNKKIKVLGKIKLYKDRPQIIIDNPYDISIVD